MLHYHCDDDDYDYDYDADYFFPVRWFQLVVNQCQLMKLKCMQLQKNKPAATPEIATTQVSIITFNAAVSAEAKCRFCLCLAMPYYGTEIKNSCFLSKHWVHLGLHMNPYMFKGSGR